MTLFNGGNLAAEAGGSHPKARAGLRLVPFTGFTAAALAFGFAAGLVPAAFRTRCGLSSRFRISSSLRLGFGRARLLPLMRTMIIPNWPR